MGSQLFRTLAQLMLGAVLCLPITRAAIAEDVSRAYSATAVHTIPGQETTLGLVVKSGQDMRLEFERDGSRTVQILRPTLGVMYILDVQNNSYIEILGPSVPADQVDGIANPCPNQTPSDSCRLEGQDTVSGISVDRWLVSSQAGPPAVILWDATRQRALRQEFPGGGGMTMTFKAMEEINGRRTEHWAIEYAVSGQEPQSGDWWFDPEIRVSVREEMPSGEIRWLEDIAVGPVDPAAFIVPEGWIKQELPVNSNIQVPESTANN